MFLSVVIPTRDEGQRLPGMLREALDFLRHQDWDWEILVCDNGSLDDTCEKAQALGAAVLRLPRGTPKGEAIRRGMLQTSGSWRLMADADGAVPFRAVEKLLQTGADVTIGVRPLIRPGQNPYRKLTSWAFAVAQLPLTQVRDSQCGFKLFSGPVAHRLFEQLEETSLAFDVALLLHARKLGLRIAQVPVPWYDPGPSHVTFLTGLRGFLGLGDLWIKAIRDGSGVRCHGKN